MAVLSALSVVSRTVSNITFSLTTDVLSGICYAVAVPENDPAPSDIQIMAGTDSTDTLAPNAFFSFSSLTDQFTIYGLSASTAYTVYTVQNSSSIIDVEIPSAVEFLSADTFGSTLIPLTVQGADDVGITHYMITESSIQPAFNDVRWLATAPVNYDVTTFGRKKISLWVKDAANNVSIYVDGLTDRVVRANQTPIERYVEVTAPGGGNGSSANPWTLTEAVQQAIAGHRVNVRAGTYQVLNTFGPDIGITGIKPQNSGVDGNPITFRANPGDSPVIDQLGAGIGFYIDGKSFIRIDGFEITNTNDTNGSDKYGGIVAFNADDIVSENNTIHGCDAPNGNNNGAVRYDSTTNSTIRNNTLYDVFVGGVSNGNASGIHSYLMGDVVIENNTIYNANNGIFHKSAPLNDACVIRKNIVHSTNRAMFFDVAGGGSNAHKNQRIIQNILYNNLDNVYLKAPAVDISPRINDGFHLINNTVVGGNSALTAYNVINLNVYNNLFIGPFTHKAVRMGDDIIFGSFMSSTVLYYDNNNYFNGEEFIFDYDISSTPSYNSLAAWQAGTGADLNSISTDPLFVNAAANDYKLQAGSASINAGRNGITMGAYITGNETIGAS